MPELDEREGPVLGHPSGRALVPTAHLRHAPHHPQVAFVDPGPIRGVDLGLAVHRPLPGPQQRADALDDVMGLALGEPRDRPVDHDGGVGSVEEIEVREARVDDAEVSTGVAIPRDVRSTPLRPTTFIGVRKFEAWNPVA